MDMDAGVIWTVGHSNRPMVELIGLLTDQSISVLADVRRFPGSKRQPQFAKDSLEGLLYEAGIGYRHFEALGGRRSRIQEDSPNTGWRSESFHAYADHMQTGEFQAALAELMALGDSSPTAILCARRFPGDATGRSSPTPWSHRVGRCGISWERDEYNHTD